MQGALWSFTLLVSCVSGKSFYYAEEVLTRHARQTQQQIQNSIQRPQVASNMGASSSSSITNVAAISLPKNISDGKPGLKLGQGLAVAISIQGPQGGPTNNSFANTQLFNANPATDFGSATANAGSLGPNKLGTMTGTNISFQGGQGFGQASTFNQANVNAFNVGPGGNGSKFTSAGAFGEVRG